MKPANYLRNTALTMMLLVTATFTFSQSDPGTSKSLNSEKTEFAKAGYWIDAVVVNAGTVKSDRELLADKGYYIEPVVVTYKHTVPDYLDTQDGNALFTAGNPQEYLEVSLLDDDQER